MKKSSWLILTALAELFIFGLTAGRVFSDIPLTSSRRQAAGSSVASGSPVATEYNADSYQQPEKNEKVKDESVVTLIAVGDIMLSRNVAAKMKKYGADYPFASTTAILHQADFAFGNLESPITAGPVVPTGSFTFHADPGAEAALRDANFRVLSLANNHFLNYGRKGVSDTLKLLDSVGIKAAGAGLDEAAAYAPAYYDSKGLRLAFLAYSDYKVPPAGDGATSDQAGTAKMNLEKLKAAIAEAKTNADLVIVSMHAGREYTEELTAEQTEFAHAAIDAGAELVLGHHPHVTQRAERYRGKYIFYSLGNFVFDQMWSEETRRGAMVRLYLTKQGFGRAEVMPTRIYDYARPEPARESAALEIWQRLKIEPDDPAELLPAVAPTDLPGSENSTGR